MIFVFEKQYVLFRLTTMYNNLIKTSHDTSICHDMRYIDVVLLCIDTDLKRYNTRDSIGHVAENCKAKKG